MKLIIAGGRDLSVGTELINAVICEFNLDEVITEVVSGGAYGVDTSGEKWCLKMQKLCGADVIGLKIFPADWDTHGKAAGPIRNKQMAEYADALLLIWDGESKGSGHMKRTMRELNKPIYEIIIKGESSGKPRRN